ncbi:MAG: WYL domain-containing protein [Verrucomicrobia bacterium]|nr:WYL domain-containing protein [Verrucomicrobiota bacterium]
MAWWFMPKRTEVPLPQSRPPLERMMRIHQAIAAGDLPNATTLATGMEVATKTIGRDIEFMRDRLGLPIEYDVARHGYFYTEEVSGFPTLQITEGELFALLVAEKALQQYRGTNFERPLASAFKKMSSSLPDTISLHLADWDATVSFRTSAQPVLNLEVFDAIAKAAAHHNQIEITYRKPGRRDTEARVVDPWHLANINGEWYLFAYDHLRKAVRTFVPARVQTVRATGKKFARPQKFSLAKQLEASFGVHSAEGEYDVVLRFNAQAADYVREKRWHPSQVLRELKDGGLELRLKLSSLVEIERWILGWGGSVVVAQPAELRERVRHAAGEILRHYAG